MFFEKKVKRFGVFCVFILERGAEMKKVINICQFIFLIGIVSFLFSLHAKGQTYQDSCFRQIWEHNPEKEFENPDSVMYDSCECGDIFKYFYNNDWTLPKQYFYAKQWFLVDLPFGALDVPQGPPDTVIIRNWSDISTTFSNLRTGLEEMDNIFGNYILQKRFPEDVDSSYGTSTVFLIKFDEYVKIDSVENFLNSVTDINYPLYMRAYNFNPFISVKDNLTINDFILYPQPANDFIIIEYSLLLNSNINITLTDLQGVFLGEIFSGFQDTGVNTINYPINNLPSGIYFVNININGSISNKHFIKIR